MSRRFRWFAVLPALAVAGACRSSRGGAGSAVQHIQQGKILTEAVDAETGRPAQAPVASSGSAQ